DALTAPSLVTTHPVPANCALAEIHESPLSKPTVHVTPSSAVAMTELFSLIQPRPGASKWMSPTAPPASARRLSAGGSTPAMLDEVVDGNVVDGNVVVLVGVGVVDADAVDSFTGTEPHAATTTTAPNSPIMEMRD